jgi:hypothetical protein
VLLEKLLGDSKEDAESLWRKLTHIQT